MLFLCSLDAVQSAHEKLLAARRVAVRKKNDPISDLVNITKAEQKCYEQEAVLILSKGGTPKEEAQKLLTLRHKIIHYNYG